MAEQAETVEAYIAAFPADVQEVLQALRATMHAAAPGSGEKISYQIPTLTLNGQSLVYFAGWKKHISIYPLPEGDEALDAEIAPYASGASTAKFALNKPIPHDLIGRLVAAHVRARTAS